MKKQQTDNKAFAYGTLNDSRAYNLEKLYKQTDTFLTLYSLFSASSWLREREIERERERERDRETERQRDRETETERDRDREIAGTSPPPTPTPYPKLPPRKTYVSTALAGGNKSVPRCRQEPLSRGNAPNGPSKRLGSAAALMPLICWHFWRLWLHVFG